MPGNRPPRRLPPDAAAPGAALIVAHGSPSAPDAQEAALGALAARVARHLPGRHGARRHPRQARRAAVRARSLRRGAAGDLSALHVGRLVRQPGTAPQAARRRRRGPDDPAAARPRSRAARALPRDRPRRRRPGGICPRRGGGAARGARLALRSPAARGDRDGGGRAGPERRLSRDSAPGSSISRPTSPRRRGWRRRRSACRSSRRMPDTWRRICPKRSTPPGSAAFGSSRSACARKSRR